MNWAKKEEKFVNVKRHVMVWMELIVWEKVLDSIDVVQHVGIVSRHTGRYNSVGWGNDNSRYQRYGDIKNLKTSDRARRTIILQTP